jgi:hypothetical protein
MPKNGLVHHLRKWKRTLLHTDEEVHAIVPDDNGRETSRDLVTLLQLMDVRACVHQAHNRV